MINWFREEKGTLPAEWADLDKALNGALAEALQGDDFKGEIYEAEPIRTLGRIQGRGASCSFAAGGASASA